MSKTQINTINVVESVYTKDIIYTIKPEQGNIFVHNSIVYNCKFTRSEFGSIYIERPTYDGIIELYPNSITHIFHREKNHKHIIMNQTEQPQDVRLLKDLYQLVLNWLNTNGTKEYFICNIIKEKLHEYYNIITKEECDILISHFKEQIPTQVLYSSIYNDILFDKEIHNSSLVDPSWFIRKTDTTIQDLIDIRIKLIKLIMDTL